MDRWSWRHGVAWTLTCMLLVDHAQSRPRTPRIRTGGNCRTNCRSAQPISGACTWSRSGSHRGSMWPTPRLPRGPPRSRAPTRTPLTATNRSIRFLRRLTKTASWSYEYGCRGNAGLDLSSQQAWNGSPIGPVAFLGTPPLRRRAVMPAETNSKLASSAAITTR